MILIVVPILALAIAAIIITASPRYTVMQQKIDQLHNGIGETITNERVIKSFVREEHEKEKFSRINQELVEKSTASLRMMILMQPVSTLAINVTTLAVVWFARKQTMVGTMELGTLTAFITYLSQILTALNFLANIVLQGTRAAASNRRITEVLQATIDLTDKDAAFPDREITGGSIEFQHVSFRYFKKNHQKVLNDINLSIRSGETVGIIGSTGSGKSTLLNLLMAAETNYSGHILADGIELSDISTESLYGTMAAIQQNVFVFNASIKDNVSMFRDFPKTEMDEAIARAHLGALIRERGEDYLCGENGSGLSGGEKQRISIARSLLKKSSVLLADEVTAALDAQTAHRVSSDILDLQGITRIVVTHTLEESLLRRYDKIFVLRGGRIEEAGSFAVLMANKGYFYALFTVAQ